MLMLHTVWVFILTLCVNIINGVYNPVTGGADLALGQDDPAARYFKAGFDYNSIVSFLVAFHGMFISLRTLRRCLRRCGLKRRKKNTPIVKITDFLRNELNESGSLLGYRAMHQRLIENDLQGDRETVRIMLQVVDPDGVSRGSRHRLQRRKYTTKGPNYVWHIDGNDKLKPFGFEIHGAIDGYSRRILWLCISSSNKSPYIIASYFTDYVRVLGGVPRKIRGDRGTENVNVAGIQRFLRRNHSDGLAGFLSFVYGKSVSNQRTEAWWSFFFKSSLSWWMNLFKDFRDRQMYDDSNPIQVECLRFCFYELFRMS